jgi:hypothetical protein
VGVGLASRDMLAIPADNEKLGHIPHNLCRKKFLPLIFGGPSPRDKPSLRLEPHKRRKVLARRTQSSRKRRHGE